MINQSELIFISNLNKEELKKIVGNEKWEKILSLRSQLAQALTLYSKRHRMDIIQENALSHIATLDKWLWKAYSHYYLPRFLAQNSKYMKMDKQHALRKLNADFEGLLRKVWH